MCGIVGIIGENATKFSIDAMLKAQRHRGPDAMIGQKIDENVYLGHNRLSILDLSEEANQPMTDNSGRYSIVFNGEIYNYLELKKEVSEFTYKTSGDTEVLLNGYIKYGKSFINKLNGMFSLVIYDNVEKELFVARDRFGVKPFNYSIIHNTLLFASEIKSLWAGGVPKIENEKVWSSYFAFGTYGKPDETFWKGVNQLPAGHTLTWKNGNLKISQWYDFVFAVNRIDINTSEVQKGEYYESLLKDTIELRFRADVPVGFNVSGGVDSSTLLALIKEYKGQDANINAFTFTSKFTL
jgi:asparagine synthase (glutamine-hydrolysing)